MWGDRITITGRKIIAQEKRGDEALVIVKWSVPGHYNTHIQLILK
jgi:hypothetical protein